MNTTKNMSKHANAKHAKPKPTPKPNKAKSGLTSLPEKTLKKIVNRLDKLLKLLPKKLQKK